jgi:hypothetical protein
MQTSRHVLHLDACAPAAGRTPNWVIEVAARHARNSGVEVRLILPRRPGVVTLLRDAATAADVAVLTTITSDHVTAVFGAHSERAHTRTAEVTKQ